MVKEVLDEGECREAVKRFVDAVNGEGSFERTPSELQSKMLDNARTLYELTSAKRDPFSPNDAETIKTSALLLSGERTAAFLRIIVEVLAAYLPNRECAIISRAGHPMHSQNPSDYNKTVLDFLGRI